MSMVEEDFGSDTDDEDYIPEGDGHQASEEENSGDNENTEDGNDEKKPRKSGGKKSSKCVDMPKSRPSMFDSEEKVDWTEDLNHKSEEKEKKKVDDLWADFKKDTSTSKNISKPASTGGFSSIFNSAPQTDVKTPNSSKTSSTNNRLAGLFDVEKKIETQPAKQKSKSIFSDLFDDSPKEVKSVKPSDSSEQTKCKDDKIEITKVYDFAGESVTVSKKVSADSQEAEKFLSSSKRSATGGGLSGVVGSLEKKAKLGCLDKSKMDWNRFVDENSIREELSTHNKGKDGYVEKQQFLERTDHRQFELEKAVRDKNRKLLMK